eukprot:36896-Rhodomonas_salina.4
MQYPGKMCSSRLVPGQPMSAQEIAQARCTAIAQARSAGGAVWFRYWYQHRRLQYRTSRRQITPHILQYKTPDSDYSTVSTGPRSKRQDTWYHRGPQYQVSRGKCVGDYPLRKNLTLAAEHEVSTGIVQQDVPGQHLVIAQSTHSTMRQVSPGHRTANTALYENLTPHSTGCKVTTGASQRTTAWPRTLCADRTSHTKNIRGYLLLL